MANQNFYLTSFFNQLTAIQDFMITLDAQVYSNTQENLDTANGMIANLHSLGSTIQNMNLDGGDDHGYLGWIVSFTAPGSTIYGSASTQINVPIASAVNLATSLNNFFFPYSLSEVIEYYAQYSTAVEADVTNIEYSLVPVTITSLADQLTALQNIIAALNALPINGFGPSDYQDKISSANLLIVNQLLPALQSTISQLYTHDGNDPMVTNLYNSFPNRKFPVTELNQFNTNQEVVATLNYFFNGQYSQNNPTTLAEYVDYFYDKSLVTVGELKNELASFSIPLFRTFIIERIRELDSYIDTLSNHQGPYLLGHFTKAMTFLTSFKTLASKLSDNNVDLQAPENLASLAGNIDAVLNALNVCNLNQNSNTTLSDATIYVNGTDFFAANKWQTQGCNVKTLYNVSSAVPMDVNNLYNYTVTFANQLTSEKYYQQNNCTNSTGNYLPDLNLADALRSFYNNSSLSELSTYLAPAALATVGDLQNGNNDLLTNIGSAVQNAIQTVALESSNFTVALLIPANTDNSSSSKLLTSSDLSNNASKILTVSDLINMIQQQDAMAQQLTSLQTSLDRFILNTAQYDKCSSLSDSVGTFVHSLVSTGAVIGSVAAMYAGAPVLIVAGVGVIGVAALESIWHFAVEPALCH